MKTIYLSLAAAALFGLAGAAPASAGPFSPAGVASPDSTIVSVRMTRREMRRMRMDRMRMSRRRAARQRDSINARDPSRPLRAQSQGQTSGGPLR